MGKNRQSVEEKQDLLPGCLFVLSVLTQFRHSTVRDDLISGRFTFPVHSSGVTLDEIDALHDAMFPSFHLSHGIPMKMRMKRTRSILEGIVNVSGDVLHLDRTGGKQRTHGDWFCILSELEASSYWGRRDSSTLMSSNSPQQLSCMTQELVDSSTNTVCVESNSVSVGSDVFARKSVATHTDFPCSMNPDESVFQSSSDYVSVVKVESNIDSCKPKLKMHCNEVKSVSIAVVHQDVTASSYIKSGSLISPKVPSTRLDSGDLCKMGHSLQCRWCHKRGHTLEHCWRRLQVCVICGGKHKMTLCPRYVAPTSSSFVPTCSLCNGRHLGKYCSKLRRHIHSCHWCGRHGHEESNCWVKNKCCLICGDPSHRLTNCIRFVPREPLTSSPLFPPWCANCGETHLGTDCDDPYME